MSDIRQWLGKLNLSQYADAFEEGDIDWEILPEVDRDVLKDLGVKSPGHQLRILKAIGSLEDKQQLDASPSQNTSASPTESVAERRQLTVMFCDLVGSTALSASLDPEEMREIINAYHSAVTKEIKRYGGHVAKFMGDGVMAYFGFPQAHEDDAERATFAALAITNAVVNLKTTESIPLLARVGIATGNVVVGDIIGEGISQEHAVVGDTPNLAARLESFAEPGTIAIGPSTQRLLGDLFELTDLGKHVLKGIPQPVHIWRPIGESQTENRFLAKRGNEISRLVGRDAELDLLLSRWRDSVSDEGQLVLLSGEAGIGKSRLVEALEQQVHEFHPSVLRFYCTPYHINSALHPVIVHLLRSARISSHDPAEQKLTKLRSLFGKLSKNDDKSLSVISNLLLMQNDASLDAAELSPQERKTHIFDVLLEQVEHLAGRKPVLILLEDAQWLDPTTTELFSLIIERLQNQSVMLLITSRPGFVSPWSNLSISVTSLTLARLGKTQGRDIIQRLTGEKALPVAIVDKIISKTDGVPLFVEELTKSVLESDILIEYEDRFELNGPIDSLAIPETLHDSLMSRLDRHRSVKEVAQIGSVIGREFSYELLDHVSMLETMALDSALKRVVEVELAVSRGQPPSAIYTFRHALVQETAYQSLLKEKRIVIHARIAEALEQHFLEKATVEPEVVAHHFSMANRAERAAFYWNKAGQHALSNSANVEAIDHFRQGIEHLSAIPASVERDRSELSMQLGLGAALMSVHGQGAPSTGMSYTRARELGKTAMDSGKYFQALYGCWRYHFIRSELHLAKSIGDECVEQTKGGEDAAAILGSYFALGGSLVFTGQFSDAQHYLEQAIATRQIEPETTLSVRFGQNLRLSSMSYMSWVNWSQGELSSSISLGEDALLRARRLNHAHTVAQVSGYLSITHCLFRDWVSAQKQAKETMALSEKHKFPQTYWLGAMVDGRVKVEQGQIIDGIAQIEQGIAERRAIGVEVGQQFWIALLAEAYLQNQEFDKAIGILNEAILYASRSGDQFYLPEIYRIRGEALVERCDSGNSTGPTDSFKQSLILSKKQGSHFLELRTVNSMVRMSIEEVERQRAFSRLIELYETLSIDNQCYDLTEAETTLNSAETF
ncbi:MAG: AAA family ATPase [Granulosicoccus sp.]|nr:AAA family ATPase [Granulosicoccus sp.]